MTNFEFRIKAAVDLANIALRPCYGEHCVACGAPSDEPDLCLSNCAARLWRKVKDSPIVTINETT